MLVLHPLKLYITPTPARYFRGNRKKGKILIDTCVGVCLSESVCLRGFGGSRRKKERCSRLDDSACRLCAFFFTRSFSSAYFCLLPVLF